MDKNRHVHGPPEWMLAEPGNGSQSFEELSRLQNQPPELRQRIVVNLDPETKKRLHAYSVSATDSFLLAGLYGKEGIGRLSTLLRHFIATTTEIEILLRERMDILIYKKMLDKPQFAPHPKKAPQSKLIRQLVWGKLAKPNQKYAAAFLSRTAGMPKRLPHTPNKR